MVCFMSPECLTHTRAAEICPRIKISRVPVQHGDGRVQLYYMQKRMMGPELETRRIQGRSRILQNTAEYEEGGGGFMSSTHVWVDRKSGRPDEVLGMSVLNQVQMYGMKNGVVDEKQSIILTE